MKRIVLIVALFLLSITQISGATCNSFTCGQSGGTCINGVCVIPTPQPTPTPAPNTSMLTTIQKLYCDTRICIVIVSPPDYLKQLVAPLPEK